MRLKYVEGYQYAGLLTVLVGVLFIHPYLANGRTDIILLGLVALIPAMAVVALVEHREMLWVGVGLGVPATLVLLNDFMRPPGGDLGWFEVAPLVFYGFATAVICYHVVTEPRVKTDTLLGAICGYLMLGYTWSGAFSLLVAHDPGAFYSSTQPGGVVSAGDSLYFSFVTLTTLGYGDIVPVTAKARSLAMMEAITGVLYLAVLVSRLVAMHGAAGRDRS